MKDTELYAHLLGLTSPWHVGHVVLDVKAQRVSVYAEHRRHTNFSGPECGLACPLHDHDEERSWRQLDSCQFETHLHARIPRARLHAPGHAPNARRPSRVTRRRRAARPRHNFVTNEKETIWVTDVTCFWTRAGWLFLAVMLDLYSRRVVGWATSSTNDRFLALDALRDALTRRRPLVGLIQHSDRGSPYASADYRAELDRFGIVASMSRKGDCWDNAVAESFFSTLKTELGADRVYESRDEATMIIGEHIDEFYNTTRRHSHLGYLSPIEYELRSQVAAAAA